MKNISPKIKLNNLLSILVLTLILSLILSFNLSAASYSGELSTSVIYEQESERWQDQSWLELDFQQDLSSDLNYYLKSALTLESYYQQDQKEREFEFEFKEAYLNYYTAKIDWRLGRQNFSWGSSYNINPLNYFNPIDQGAIDPFQSREAVDGIRAAYYPNFNWQLTGVLTQHAEIDELQTAVQLIRRRWRGYDLAASVFSGNSLQTVPGASNFYPEVNKIGFDFKGDFSSKNIGLFSEVVYSDYQDSRLENTNELIIGLDYKFDNNLYLLGQYYYQQLPPVQSEANQLLVLRAEKPFANFHNWELNLISDLKAGMSLVRPKVIFSLNEGLDFESGAVIKLNQKRESSLNRLNQELIYLSLSKYF
ncbi:hypothetical protein C8C76_15411 [Halanaerobium saccharolyticum]|jgi:hypothetical protein|uniref:Uncharacterized protein n=1 Tax=Halanaerobium saccharolyticum TaxID=43595 RepID=A0A2T5RFI1_9FIRM|nr:MULTISPECIES: DUF1302 family protein [Halanaerobium]PTV93071.1 hypothetical protein C8C76_15411 [Halanaerobium saccharolyticum]PUU93867.1 MAG: Uncharacterized protein CI947_778 [Halanaerobium sp.]PUU94250.1 MAG: Uncharacterized protein CI949_876 [Halanaerobium sp.]TDP89013.1 hypothetical protein C7957_12711 [Halanaerobium saccharolyticum]